jgi:hypothetical protein
MLTFLTLDFHSNIVTTVRASGTAGLQNHPQGMKVNQLLYELSPSSILIETFQVTDQCNHVVTHGAKVKRRLYDSMIGFEIDLNS